jgi:ABC-2 type transport system permease protein
VNWQHFRAFLWLRWRLRINQLKRAGTANIVILALLAPAIVVLPFVFFASSFLIGVYVLPRSAPYAPILMYVWDGVALVFLFWWAVGLVSELQRSEALSLDKFLHLPVSLKGVFLINYLSSLASLNLLVFVPGMVGLSLGLVFSRGPDMLLLLPLVAAFLFMVTAVTYQFQGWLASLMANPRRRRTVIVLVTIVFVLICQLPQLVNILKPWQRQERMELSERQAKDLAQNDRAFAEGKIRPHEHAQRQGEINNAFREQTEAANRESEQQFEETVWLINLVLPPGWLPLGVRAVAKRDFPPALLCMFGLTLIGTASLWRAYRTTMRLYTGHYSSGKGRGAQTPAPAQAARPSAGMLEWEIPWLSQQASAIAVTGLRSLMRAPEAKMMLLSPIIMVVVFGGIFFAQPMDQMPEGVRPLLAFGGMSMVLFGMVQFIGNQFGFDRSGFKVFVLCGARRRDILLGKNLAFAPMALGLGAVVGLLVEALCPMRFDYFLATLCWLVSMYLVLCLLANFLSILAPMPIAAGSLKPTNVKLIPVILQVVFVFMLPIMLAPILLPLGIELLVEALGWVDGVPICLLLSVVEGATIVYLYGFVLTWQGDLLHARELKILETVTTKTE